VVGGEAVAAEYALSLPAVIGRSRSASIKVPQALVSRRHCELYEEQGHLVVRDLGSLNGTFIGSDRISQDTVLPPGGLLTIGSITFKAEYEAPPDAEAEDAESDQTVRIARASKARQPVVEDPGTAAFDEPPLQLEEPEPVGARSVESPAHEVADELELDLPDVEGPVAGKPSGSEQRRSLPAGGDLETVPLQPSGQPDAAADFAPPERKQPNADESDDLDDFFRSLDLK
jgi:predicted component of type VI protein secretion system